MSPNDIVIGKKYRNHYFRDYIYLGARKYFGSNLGDFEKILVVIEAPEDVFESIGAIVCDPVYCGIGYWDGFYVDEGETVE